MRKILNSNNLPKGEILNYQNGYVLVSVLVMMAVILAITYYLADILYSEYAIARNQRSATIAFNLAEAGTQEAIWRVQNDNSIDGAREKFMNTPDGKTSFSHNPALVPNGSYSVDIQNNAKGVATVTSTGAYAMGLKTAQRKIKVDIAEALQPPAYPYDGAIFASGSGTGSSIADIDFWNATVKIYNASLLSNRDINLKFSSNIDIEKSVEAGRKVVNQSSNLDCNCLINDDGNPATPQCTPPPGCSTSVNVPYKEMLQMDFEAYKTIAKNTYGPSPDGNQFFADGKDFQNLIPFLGNRIFNGVVYVDDSIDLLGQSVNINGILAAKDTITLHSAANINIAPPPGGGASGVLTQKNFNIRATCRLNGTGLIYAGDRLEWYTMTETSNLRGGIIARRVWFFGSQITNIYYDVNVINTALGNPVNTPVIKLDHWEEEY